tara:strand:- start:3109 stop:4083 length:975 start_codon:yes stop_codon:yes gene_type:complete
MEGFLMVGNENGETQQLETESRRNMDAVLNATKVPTRTQTKRRKTKSSGNITKATNSLPEIKTYPDVKTWTGTGIEVQSLTPMIKEMESVIEFLSRLNGGLDGVKVALTILEPKHRRTKDGVQKRHGEARIIGWTKKAGTPPKGMRKGSTTVEDTTDPQYRDSFDIVQIGISGDAFAMSYWDVIETVIHELAHVLNFALDVKDTAKSGQHNAKFAAAAQTLGLALPKGKTKEDKRAAEKIGDCKITDDIKKKIKANVAINSKVFDKFQGVIASNQKKPRRQINNRLNWVCPSDSEKNDNCGMVTSYKQDLDILCGEHGEAYQVK